MLKKLVHDKINEVLLTYQEINNITDGDIHPMDALALEEIGGELVNLIAGIVESQQRAKFEEFIPSWYLYKDSEGIMHSETFGQITEDQFFTKVSRRIAFDDINGETVEKIYYRGEEFIYMGWQPCMKFEYQAIIGDTVWVGQFENWDH